MFWETLAATKKPFFALAPMIDVTDTVFRQIVASCAAPDVFFTEFVSVDALASPGATAMASKLAYGETDQPLIVQIWGLDPKNYEKQCAQLVKSFSGIDINMGCPVAKVVSKGACSALMNDRGLAKDIIAGAISGANLRSTAPVSVKTRIGFNEIDLSWIEFLLQQDLSALTIHCRTVQEQSKVPNHFEVLPEIVKMRNEISPSTKLIANGDITSHKQGIQLAQEHKLDGVMIGRGVFSDPFVFDKNSPWKSLPPEQKISLFSQHIELFDRTFGRTKNPDILKKFAKVYVTGFSGAPRVREHIMGLKSLEAVNAYIEDLKDSLNMGLPAEKVS